MKKYILLFLFLLIPSLANSATGVHWFIGLTGGTSTSLDRYDDEGTDAYADGNIAIGVDDSGYFYSYQYDSTLVQSEDSPDYIVPDDNATGTGCWVLQVAADTRTASEILDMLIALGTWDLSTVDVTVGGWTFTGADSSPSVSGEISYDSVVTGFAGGLLAWYSNRLKYIADFDALPTKTGEKLQYNSDNDELEFKFETIHKSWNFDPDAVCDGSVDRLFLMTVADNTVIIEKWKLSFQADPTTEADLDLKRADAFIGVANSAVMDVLDTTNGASSESTAANINGGAAVANGKVIYLEFGTAYTATGQQIIFEMWYHHV